MNSHILLAVDGREVIDSVARTILDEHIVTVATSGERALSVVDGTIDLVFLEHQFVDLVGDKLFDRIREQEYSCQVAIIAETETNFDTADSLFDACLTKPIDDTDLTTTTRRLSKRSELDEALKRHAVLVAERCEIKQKYSEQILAQNQQFRNLETEIDQLEERIRSLSADLKDKDVFEVITYPSVESELNMAPTDIDT